MKRTLTRRLSYFPLTRVNVPYGDLDRRGEKVCNAAKHHEMAYCIGSVEKEHVTAGSLNADILGRYVSGGSSSINDAPRSDHAFNSAIVKPALT